MRPHLFLSRPLWLNNPYRERRFPLPTTKEQGEGQGERLPRIVHVAQNKPLSLTLSPLVLRGARECMSRPCYMTVAMRPSAALFFVLPCPRMVYFWRQHNGSSQMETDRAGGHNS